ncbi:MAG: TIGR04283 family arsenosugar biosynthesis glycosyltransferase, partial [Ectothiorhodospiraceae bacterium]
EVLVVDGGSGDDTRALAEPLADRVLTGSHGRAGQMNHGARMASGDVLWFLHADTRVGPEQFRLLPVVCHGGRRIWGRFDVRLDAGGAAFRMIATGMNLRSRWSGIATGDQAMFVTRRLFEAVGGFPEWPLMEDVALSRALRDRVFPVCFRERVTTSARRWQDNGVWRTVWLMWRLRLAFYMGADPEVLQRRYNGGSA